MVGSSKILTVSYGTFSCTLEGFDDPFSTMRSIAEYFRDLAADDRYFGAEPPTPDAEMLHRIAQREVQRRVEARVSDTGIVLSQSDEDETSGDAGKAPLASLQVRKAAAGDQSTAPPASAAVDKLDRIRAVVERARSRPASTSAWRAPSERVMDHAGQGFDDVHEDDEPADVVMPLAGYPGADGTDPDMLGTDTDATDAYAATEAHGSVEDPRDDADLAVEDEDATEPDMPDGDATYGAHAVPETLSAAAEEDDGEGEPVAEAAPVVEDDIAEDDTPQDAIEAEHEPAAAAHAEDIADDDGVTEGDEGADTQAEADREHDETDDEDLAERIIRLSRAGEASHLISDDDADNAASDQPATGSGLHRPVAEAPRAAESDRKDQRPGRGHVLIGRDPDREPAFKRILEETNSKMADREGTRRRSAIAHLKAAVQATKADRMLKRERSRQVDAEEQSAYRDDLAKVVRPHSSEPAEVAAARIVAQSRTEDDEPSPLVLMSSQRIDPARARDDRDAVASGIAAEADGTDIDEMYSDDYEAFAEFAAEAGATEITDLLEAAAAFTAYVGEQPHFSRPQIMRLAAAASRDEDFTREAGLRSFGQLLRQGRIQKLQRGQFAISGNTRFRPGTRIAGE